MKERDNKGRFITDSEPNTINLTVRIPESLNNRLKAIVGNKKTADLVRQAILNEVDKYEQDAW